MSEAAALMGEAFALAARRAVGRAVIAGVAPRGEAAAKKTRAEPPRIPPRLVARTPTPVAAKKAPVQPPPTLVKSAPAAKAPAKVVPVRPMAKTQAKAAPAKLAPSAAAKAPAKAMPKKAPAKAARK